MAMPKVDVVFVGGGPDLVIPVEGPRKFRTIGSVEKHQDAEEWIAHAGVQFNRVRVGEADRLTRKQAVERVAAAYGLCESFLEWASRAGEEFGFMIEDVMRLATRAAKGCRP